MSVLLSSNKKPIFSLTYDSYNALKIRSFRDIQKDGMIFSLSPNLGHPQGAMSVTGSIGQHFEEIGLADVVGAGAGDEDAARAKHLQGAQVEFFVAAERRVKVALGLGEGGRIENDGVIALPGSGVVLEQVEGVGFDPFDFG